MSVVVTDGRTASRIANEKRVAELLARGLPNRAICDALALPLPTVKMHVRSVMQQLHVANRTQAAIKLNRTGELEQRIAQ